MNEAGVECKPYRHADFRVPSCPNMCGCSSHGVRKTAVTRHHAAFSAIATDVPTMQAAEMEARTIRRGDILCRVRVLLLLHEKSVVGGVWCCQHGP